MREVPGALEVLGLAEGRVASDFYRRPILTRLSTVYTMRYDATRRDHGDGGDGDGIFGRS